MIEEPKTKELETLYRELVNEKEAFNFFAGMVLTSILAGCFVLANSPILLFVPLFFGFVCSYVAWDTAESEKAKIRVLESTPFVMAGGASFTKDILEKIEFRPPSRKVKVKVKPVKRKVRRGQRG